MSKWDCSLEEERIPSSGRVETVSSKTLNSCHVNANLQVSVLATSGNGTGAEKVKDLPSSSSFLLQLFLLSPILRRGEVGNMR